MILYISAISQQKDFHQQGQRAVPVAKCWKERAALKEKLGLEGNEELDEWELPGLMG